MHLPSKISRRRMLALSAAGAAASFTGLRAAPTSDVIRRENARPGTTTWQLTFVRTQGCRSADIEGYCSDTSVRAGGRIGLFLSAQPATEVSVDVYRLGWYGGKGGRHVAKFGPFKVSPQPVPPVGENRLRECRWQQTAEIEIPADWVSGVYVGKLSCTAHRYESYVIFVVRDDRVADLLFQTSDTTWQAYNKWPEQHSLYDTD
ncbi:MAG: hypothetical protein RJB55_2379, partial [Verrucomicrobiota bacterium]